MDFFSAQARARRQSRLLGWAFAACLLAVVLVLDAAVLTVLRIGAATGAQPEPFGSSLLAWALQHPAATLATSLVVGGFVGVASLHRMLQLREGGGYLARSLGGVRVERDTPDARRRMLHNIVDEMALASGVPTPEVYVLEQEESINAFAAGHTPANAAVAVTRGALHNLSRDQLQGVIAHEFSHILNGDMRLSMRLVGLVFGLMAVALAGRLLIRLAANGERSGWPLMALGLCIAIVGQIGFWSGRILQAWISRQRECLADASAVQFTRNPDGLRDALVRAAALGSRRRFAGAGLEEVAHMLFLPGAPRLLATHPTLLQRVQALDPNVNKAQLEAMVRRAQATPAPTVVSAAPAANTKLGSAVPAAAALIAAGTGVPQHRHLQHAIAVRHALPAALRSSIDAPEHAQVMILALLIHANPKTSEQQLQQINTQLGSDIARSVADAANVTADLDPMLRLPAVLQLFAALRSLPASARLHLLQLLRTLSRSDGQLSVFEYALEKLVARGLAQTQSPRDPHGSLALADLAQHLGVMFSVLARHGARNDSQAQQAYEAGIAPLLPQRRPAYNIIEDWVPAFDAALDEVCALRITAKQMLIEGLVRTIAHDAILAAAEAELLRAICGVLECPMPPVLAEPANVD